MRLDIMKQHVKILKQASKGKCIQVNIVPFRRVTVVGEVLTLKPDAFEHTFIKRSTFLEV